ncbi:putative ribosome-binding factor A, mitochondrial isoform X1 [Dermacentor albipictus]|uniref:putative ribosome-binding factor A, mitochondrial isoform X1 n=1 Tax=Dermacentor albipictus TaxID=60249 RepID=UPI0031FCC165
MAAHRIMSGRLAVCGFAMAELRCVLGRFAETPSTYVYLRKNFSVCHRENAKLGVFLHKLLDKSKKRHPQQYVYVLPNSAVPSAPKKVQERTRRQRVLNTVFMESLSNIMVTGAISEELKGFAVELTQVRVSADCTHLNIYWVTALQEPGVDKKVAEILHSSAGYLKSELIKNGFIGKAPKITFVRDVTHGRAAEVERLIDKVCADLPPDLDHSASRDLQASGSEGANTAEESLQTGPYVPPEMKMDIYGLDRAALIRQVLLKTKGQSRIPLEELAPLKPGSHNSEEAQARILSLAEYVRQRKRKSNLQVKAEREAQRNLQSVQLSPSNELLSSSTPDSRVDSEDIYDEDDFCNVSFLKED